MRRVIYILSFLLTTNCAEFGMDNFSLGSDLLRFDCTNPVTGDFQLGDGSLENPYVICSEAQLMLIDNSVSNLQSNYILGLDLDFQSFPFEPIGNYNSVTDSGEAFSGNFDGNSLAISNISYSTPSADFSTGLFANTNGSLIHNLNLVNISMTGDMNTGLLIGRGVNTSVEDINAQGNVFKFSSGSASIFRVGGIVGEMFFNTAGNYFIRNITVEADVRGDDLVGLIYGRVYNDSTPGVSFNLENIVTRGDIIDANNNTIGGVGGITDFRGDNISLVYRNIDHIGDVTITGPVGGSWSGLVFGQFYLMNGDNLSLVFEDVSVQGELNTIANFNQRGVLGSIFGNLVFSNSTNSNISIQRVAAEADINIIASASANGSIGGLIGRIVYSDSLNLNIDIQDAYYKGSFNSPNNMNFSSLGGFAGMLIGSGAAVANISLTNFYSEHNVVAPFATVTDSLALVGRFSSGSESIALSNVYFNAPSSVATPVGSLGATELTSTQLMQGSSFSGFDFSNVWRIDNGLGTPTLR